MSPEEEEEGWNIFWEKFLCYFFSEGGRFCEKSSWWWRRTLKLMLLFVFLWFIIVVVMKGAVFLWVCVYMLNEHQPAATLVLLDLFNVSLISWWALYIPVIRFCWRASDWDHCKASFFLFHASADMTMYIPHTVSQISASTSICTKNLQKEVRVIFVELLYM